MFPIVELKEEPRSKPIHRIILYTYLTTCIAVVGTLRFYYRLAWCQLFMSKWVIIMLLGLFLLMVLTSQAIRCVLTLTIPILCTSRGRSLIIAFAFVLVATGPTANILKNVDELGRSMSCTQEQLKEAMGDMLDMLKQPLVTVKEALTKVLNSIRKVMKDIEVMLYHIKELVFLVLAGIKNAYDWLSGIVEVCNSEFGTPFDQCMAAADRAIDDCRQKLGKLNDLCEVTNIFHMLCYSAKIVDYVCVMIDYATSDFIKQVEEKLQKFVEDVKSLFDVRIQFDHDFYFKTVASQNLSDVASNILGDIHRRTQPLFIFFDWVNLVGAGLVLSVLFNGYATRRATFFRAKFIRNVRYKNVYLTADFYEVHEQRKRQDQELVLPLSYVEKTSYVALHSIRLTKPEMLKLARSTLFMLITCVQIFCICLADYSLFWVLSLIRHFGDLDSKVHVPTFMTLEVKGGGFVADVVRGVARAFEPGTQAKDMDFGRCLPQPHAPNFLCYAEIAAICAVAWVFMCLEPYALRFCHHIMRHYYPDVAHERAVWLYTEILFNRASLFTLARRKARAKFIFGSSRTNTPTCLDWLRVKCSRWLCCRLLLGPRRGSYCNICGQPLSESERIPCTTLDCFGVYCPTCYEQSNKLCCLCHSPLNYGDASDVSEERDSSDEAVGKDTNRTGSTNSASTLHEVKINNSA